MATMQTPTEPGERLDAEAALRFPLGAASPLWLAFFGAAATASAWWWMNRWAREMALDGAGAAVAAGALPAVPMESATFASEDDEEQDDEPVAGAVEAISEAAGLVIDPMIQAPVAIAPEPGPPAIVPEAAEATIEAASEAVDDLTRLVGVGPRLAASLAERGVTRFAQIAAWSAEELAEVDKALNLRGRAGRDAWISQARRLSSPH